MADDNPSDDEFLKAQQIIARRNAAIIAEREAKFQPLKDFVASDCFSQLNAALASLPTDLTILPEVSPHVNAIRTGMAGLTRLSPVPAPIAAA